MTYSDLETKSKGTYEMAKKNKIIKVNMEMEEEDKDIARNIFITVRKNRVGIYSEEENNYPKI